jgi:hypothetical protein
VFRALRARRIDPIDQGSFREMWQDARFGKRDEPVVIKMLAQTWWDPDGTRGARTRIWRSLAW